ncbi:Myb-like_DNA-binding domain-containing protein [Hexamita inflata]|uniref:Myb-like DNA-binding domain-containing protein n=1 Tax=Hexamita inflata TaxID=28002 RepID=A0AA86QQG5_9EUKA|nr:Myb-like DNA-binding domain-containing protein [Hexamita inflata]
MQKKEWSLEEVQNLVKITSDLKLVNRKLDWVEISNQMQTRTAQQCKSYYSNVIKKNMNVECRENHTWSKTEILSLWTMGVNFGSDYQLIQKTCFQHLSIKQISSQWKQIQKMHQEQYQVFENIIQDPKFIQTLNQKMFTKLYVNVLLGCSRMQLINDKLLNKQQSNEPDYGHPVDITEIKAFEAYFKKISPQQLLQIFLNEQTSRGLPDIDLSEYA